MKESEAGIMMTDHSSDQYKTDYRVVEEGV